MFIEPVNALNRWWPCTCLKCVSGLGWLERNLDFLRCIHVFDLVLKFGSDIKEGNWLQLLHHFIGLMGLNALVIWMKFFKLCFRFRMKFSRIALWGERLHLDSKSDLTMNWLILGFFVQKRILSFTSYLYGLKSEKKCSIVYHFDEFDFYRCLSWGVFWYAL